LHCSPQNCRNIIQVARIKHNGHFPYAKLGKLARYAVAKTMLFIQITRMKADANWSGSRSFNLSNSLKPCCEAILPGQGRIFQLIRFNIEMQAIKTNVTQPLQNGLQFAALRRQYPARIAEQQLHFDSLLVCLIEQLIDWL